MAIQDAEHCEEHCVHAELVQAVSENMPPEARLYALAEPFTVFGDPHTVRAL